MCMSQIHPIFSPIYNSQVFWGLVWKWKSFLYKIWHRSKYYKSNVAELKMIKKQILDKHFFSQPLEYINWSKFQGFLLTDMAFFVNFLSILSVFQFPYHFIIFFSVIQIAKLFQNSWCFNLHIFYLLWKWCKNW